MSELDLALAFLSGVVTGVLLDRWVLPPLVDLWIARMRGHGNERDDEDAERRVRADVYSSGRIGAADPQRTTGRWRFHHPGTTTSS